MSLSGLGIKAKSMSRSPKMAGSAPDRHMSKLSLGDRALPKLTDAFPMTQRPALGRGAGVDTRAGSHLYFEQVGWRDTDAMRSKYAPPCAGQYQSRKLAVKFESIRKVMFEQWLFRI